MQLTHGGTSERMLVSMHSEPQRAHTMPSLLRSDLEDGCVCERCFFLSVAAREALALATSHLR